MQHLSFVRLRISTQLGAATLAKALGVLELAGIRRGRSEFTAVSSVPGFAD